MKSKKPDVSANRIQYTSVAASAVAARGFSPSSSFWTNFVKRHWNRKPLVIKNPFSVPVSTTEETFAALRKASDAFEKDGAHVKWRFYKGDDGFMLEGSKLAGYVPSRSDQSLSDYAKRINAKLKRESFGLVLHELQEYHPQFYLRTREFLSGLAAQVRVRWRVMPGLFVGNYEQTPFGIHQDPANVFDFIIEGGKRIYLWPEDYFRDSFDRLRDSDFATLRRDATVLEGEPGDVLYWPGRYWHVGESLGLSIGVSAALIPVRLSNFILDEIKNEIADVDTSLFGDDGFPLSAGDVEKSPEMIAATVEQATKLLRRARHDFDFTQSLQVSWLNHMTSGGSDPAPPPLPLEMLDDDSLIRGLPEVPIVWIVSDNQIVCSANGHSVLLPAAPAIIRLLKVLNDGATLRVRDFIGKYSGVSRRDGVQFNVTEDGIRFLLAKLYSLRAIKRN
ncbi:MAG TPA: cupin domain-containing protein [Blastocatellia bacterium]|nr:cupin domain-containing protein [Blastocatellia bacterium]